MQDVAEDTTVAPGPQLRGEDGQISDEFIRLTIEALEAEDSARLHELTAGLHQADAGDVLEGLSPAQRQVFVRLLGDQFDLITLTEVDDAVRDQILAALPNATVAEGVRELDTDDAVYLLEDLGERERDDILQRLPEADRTALTRALDYPDETAGRLMQTEFIAIPPFWTVGQTIDFMRDSDDLPEDFYEIFIVDPMYRPIGTVSLNHLLRTKRPVTLNDIMDDELYTVVGQDDQEEVAHLFEQYDLVSAAAIEEEGGRMVGVITVDDILDVIQEEVDEDIKRLAGVGDEEISDSVLATTRSRFTWLLVNLGTAVMASGVIAMFDATIEQMVALAILMPIVASMGGNAGTQTMTVAVRALSTRDMAGFRTRRTIARETLVGFLNGCMFAAIMGAVAWAWFGNPQLGVIVGVAMVVNLLAAGLFGILIPIGLAKCKIDPAIASGTFVTTVTDVVGFFAFLGLAAWWFGLG